MIDENLLEFEFANETIKFPKKVVLHYYNWLSSLFNLNNDFGEEKNTLDVNLTYYIEKKNNNNLRHILYVLKCLESYYNEYDINKCTDLLDQIICSKYKNVLYITEKFLDEGPGKIKGIDNEFICKICNYETIEIPPLNDSILNKPKNTHNFFHINGSNIICQNCGLFINTLTTNVNAMNLTYNHCFDNINCINHIFDIE
tara:strand:- start:2 stop:601 length:600 start_codon:yes stop_codon:yes gene_type:complete